MDDNHAADSPESQTSAAKERQQQFELQQKVIAQRSAAIKHKIGIISGKGGVGKTTIAVGIASVLAAQGQAVGLLDTDITGPNVPLMIGVEAEKPRFDVVSELIEPVVAPAGVKVMSMGMLSEQRDTPVIWRGPLRSAAIRQLVADVDWGELDYLIIDLPPGTGDEPLTVAQSIPGLDGMIVVSTPQQASLQDCRKAINFTRQLDLEVLGVVENMSGFICPHCGKETPIFSVGGAEDMAKEMGVAFLGRLPVVPEVVTSTDQGIPLTDPDVPEAVRQALADIVARLPH